MKQEILADSENVKVVRDIYEFEFDFRQMPNGYVSELISNDEIEQWNRQETIENIYWQPNLPVFISAQTGSGKNYFITHNLRLYAKEQGYNILYISNRVALDFQQKQELAKLTHVKLYKNEESWENTETFDNVTVTTYQKLYKYFSTKEKNWFKKFQYVVFDECHFFYSDALFNINTGYILEKIKDFFADSIRIYMSATFDYILEPICKEEIAILNNKINEINYQISNQPETYYPTYITMLPHPLRKSKNYLPKAEYYFNNNVITYEFPRDFSQYDYKFFSKINQIEELIKETNNNDKWLIFLDDKKACKKLCNNLNSFFLNKMAYLHRNLLLSSIVVVEILAIIRIVFLLGIN